MQEINNFDTYFHFDHLVNKSDLNLHTFFKLVQLGDISCSANYIGPVHLQLCYEISYIVSGEGKFVCDNIQYPVKKGDIILNRIGEEHYIVSDKYNPMRFYYIGFTIKKNAPNSISHKIYSLFQNRESPVCRPLSSNIPSIFSNLLHEIKENFEFKQIVIDSCINQLICSAYRIYTNVSTAQSKHSDQNLKTEDILYSVVHYIEHNIQNICKITEVSDYLGYSHPYISSLFSNKMGKSMKNFFDQKRINLAADLISSGNSITNTSIELHFDSVQSFSHTFKRIMGCSPSEYISNKKIDD